MSHRHPSAPPPSHSDPGGQPAASSGGPRPLRHQDRILVALDMTGRERALALTRALDGLVGGIKVGLEFFNAHGAAGVQALRAAREGDRPRGAPPPDRARLFLDLKFHDIPQTVAGAVRAVMPLAPWMLNLHATGGPAMMQAARAAADFEADTLGIMPPMLLAVTVLTSMDDADLAAVGQSGKVADQVSRLARMARDNGMDGVVCSPREVARLRQELGPDFLLVVPGIRPAGGAVHDQKRIMTPAAALEQGADFLVIGRAITGADDPAAAARSIAADMARG